MLSAIIDAFDFLNSKVKKCRLDINSSQKQNKNNSEENG